ncbi:polysaccharide pyruvyl transferase family protein [Candidatus Wolfebacteria bacterium]|nr:polysaccharide pyruvyl transferase family protein [Candidatus Wolfebacteria bacterium]
MRELNPQKYLEKYTGAPVDFFRFPGNYGDSLIWHGTKILLSSLGITERYVELSSPVYSKILFIDGGGNFVDYYIDIKDFLLKKANVYKEIVILPHTIFGEQQVEILNSVQGDLTVFCREKISAEFIEKKLTHGKLYVWHDCAFYNSFEKIPGKGSGILNAFRIDKESVCEIPESNMDISYNGYAQKPLDEFLVMIRKYKEVHTDRLHVAIGAALLGKQVRLFPNSYYKNKAVFDYSLSKFPNVSFVE